MLKIQIRTILLVAALIFAFSIRANEIEAGVAEIIKGKKATVGFAVNYNGKIIAQYNEKLKFPMLSVFKYHIALAVLHKIDVTKDKLDRVIHIKASQMRKNTYSPLRDKYPNQDIDITLAELLRYCVSKSDNNACDFLIGYVGSPSSVDKYVRSLGFKDFQIKVTEHLMHQKWGNQYLNWSTPVDAVKLLKYIDDNNVIPASSKAYLKQLMIETTTAMNKIKGQLPSNVIVGHKSGNSDRNKDGLKAADNDIGFVILPDGRKYYISLFITNSMESNQTNELIIAQISKLVYDYMIAEK